MKWHENLSSQSCAVPWRQLSTHDEDISFCFTIVPYKGGNEFNNLYYHINLKHDCKTSVWGTFVPML